MPAIQCKVLRALARRQDPASASTPNAQIRWAIGWHLTERVFAGQAGLLTLADRPLCLVEYMPELIDVVAVEFPARTSGTRFQAVAPFAPLADITLGGSGAVLSLSGATATGYFAPANDGAPPDVAMARSTYGSGRSVILGFDPSTGSAQADAALLVRRAVDDVTPHNRSAPLGVTGIRLQVSSTTASAASMVRERLTAPAVAVSAQPAGMVGAGGASVEWTADLAEGGTKSFWSFVRLPDEVGTYAVEAEVRSSSPGTTGGAKLTLAIANDRTGADLISDAVALVEAVGEKKDGFLRGEILRCLRDVQTRTVSTRADVETNLSDLIVAVDDAKMLTAATKGQIRQSLDEVLRYWEARWYVF